MVPFVDDLPLKPGGFPFMWNYRVFKQCHTPSTTTFLGVGCLVSASIQVISLGDSLCCSGLRVKRLARIAQIACWTFSLVASLHASSRATPIKTSTSSTMWTVVISRRWGWTTGWVCHKASGLETTLHSSWRALLEPAPRLLTPLSRFEACPNSRHPWRWLKIQAGQFKSSWVRTKRWLSWPGKTAASSLKRWMWLPAWVRTNPFHSLEALNPSVRTILCLSWTFSTLARAARIRYNQNFGIIWPNFHPWRAWGANVSGNRIWSGFPSSPFMTSCAAKWWALRSWKL